MERFVLGIERALAALAAMAMVAAFAVIVLGVAARWAGWDLPGLDAYAGYAIAAALFLALPHTLRRQEHIRVTLLLDRVPARWRAALEGWCLLAGTALAGFMAWYALRLVWLSRSLHDVSQAADATPLWIPQTAMALGCAGFALSMASALLAHLGWRGLGVPLERATAEAAHVE